MKITFDLKDAKVFIPNGRFMNLKLELGVNETIYHVKEMLNDLNINVSFDIQSFLDKNVQVLNSENQTDRQSAYMKYVQKKADELMNEVMKSHHLKVVTKEIQSAAQTVLNDSVVQKKLQKLALLKNLNNF